MQIKAKITQGNCLLNVAYYKLWARKYFAYYVIGQGAEGHEAGGTKETISQALTILRMHRIWETIRKKPKIAARMGLCSSQRCGSTVTDTMKSDLPDVVRNVIQANYWDGTSSINKSCRVLHSQLKALQLGGQI